MVHAAKRGLYIQRVCRQSKRIWKKLGSKEEAMKEAVKYCPEIANEGFHT